MRLQSLSRLLQDGNGQFVVGCQTQDVVVVADMAMGPPGPFRDAPLMVSGEVTHRSHKAERVLLFYPSKPLLCIRADGKQPLLRTDHHIATIPSILDAWDDMNRLAWRFGHRRRLGGGVGRTPTWLLWLHQRNGSRPLDQQGEGGDLL